MNTRSGSNQRLGALLLCLVPLLTWACAAPATAPTADIESTARATASPAATAFVPTATPAPTVAPTRTVSPTSTPAPTSVPTATVVPAATQTGRPPVPPGAHVTGASSAPVTMEVFFNFT